MDETGAAVVDRAIEVMVATWRPPTRRRRIDARTRRAPTRSSRRASNDDAWPASSSPRPRPAPSARSEKPDPRGRGHLPTPLDRPTGRADIAGSSGDSSPTRDGRGQRAVGPGARTRSSWPRRARRAARRPRRVATPDAYVTCVGSHVGVDDVRGHAQVPMPFSTRSFEHRPHASMMLIDISASAVSNACGLGRTRG